MRKRTKKINKIHSAVKLKVHFMGIGGSGMSGAALLAHSHGYQVTGCDLERQTDYLNQVKEAGIVVFKGHDEKHLKDVDILVASPAVIFQKVRHIEYESAVGKMPVMTWEKFLGERLQRNKKVISVAGTHGKSTTTAMAASLFEQAGEDPEVMVGAKVRKWNRSYRVGSGKYFIVEADEFFDNFLNYSSETIILNNIEFDPKKTLLSTKTRWELKKLLIFYQILFWLH
jgi:UDP-N-acetylmuramate-alanine ligase